MKINSITTNIGYLKGRATERTLNRGSECAHERQNLKQYNNEQINTTIKMQNSDGRASFKGAIKMPALHKIANFAESSPLIAEALFAILITCGLRPLTILATANTEEEKSKCSYQAAKSISSGVVGLATTALIGTPIKAAIAKSKNNKAFDIPKEIKVELENVVNAGVAALKNVKENSNADDNIKNQITNLIDGELMNLDTFKKAGKGAEKSFIRKIKQIIPEQTDDVINAIKQQRALNNYAGTSKNVMEKLFQPVFMPLRATITIALVPVLLNAMGIKKGGKKQQPQQTPQETLKHHTFKPNNENEIFKSFTGATNYASK